MARQQPTDKEDVDEEVENGNDERNGPAPDNQCSEPTPLPADSEASCRAQIQNLVQPIMSAQGFLNKLMEQAEIILVHGTTDVGSYMTSFVLVDRSLNKLGNSDGVVSQRQFLHLRVPHSCKRFGQPFPVRNSELQARK